MFLHEQIAKLTRRLKSIEENPRPEFMKCNKLRYELELEDLTGILESWQAGKPFAILEGVHALCPAMGFEAQGFIGWGDRVLDPLRYLDIVVNQFGFPEHACDRTMTALGLFLSGEVPMPRLIAARRVPCDPERWAATAAAKYAGVLFFELARLNSTGDENIRCMAEQVEELIEFAEKSVPGIKYSEDKLIELLEMDDQGQRLLRDTYELRKRVPCPISPQDSFRLGVIPSAYSNPAKAVEYCRQYRDEMFERADKGIGGVPEEKLRIAWMSTGPYGRETFDLLTRKGVSLPWFHYGSASYRFGVVRDDYGDESTYGRKLTPLEEMGRYMNGNAWGGTADTWIDPLIKVCRELKIDAVVDFMQVGCITTNNLQRLTAERVKKELGIPTIELHGRQFFDTEAARRDMNKKLEEFIDVCIANKQ